VLRALRGPSPHSCRLGITYGPALRFARDPAPCSYRSGFTRFLSFHALHDRSYRSAPFAFNCYSSLCSKREGVRWWRWLLRGSGAGLSVCSVSSRLPHASVPFTPDINTPPLPSSLNKVKMISMTHCQPGLTPKFRWSRPTGTAQGMQNPHRAAITCNAKLGVPYFRSPCFIK
jgi:hypothetical protein